MKKNKLVWHASFSPCQYQKEYKISTILQPIKGKTSKRYQDILLQESPDRYEKLRTKAGNRKVFRFWQASGGFDRNLYHANAIHSWVIVNLTTIQCSGA